jgi:hypothetical protein
MVLRVTRAWRAKTLTLIGAPVFRRSRIAFADHALAVFGPLLGASAPPAAPNLRRGLHLSAARLSIRQPDWMASAGDLGARRASTVAEASYGREAVFWA